MVWQPRSTNHVSWLLPSQASLTLPRMNRKWFASMKIYTKGIWWSSEKERGAFPHHHVHFRSSRYGGCWNKRVTSFPDQEKQASAFRGRGRQGHGRQGHGRQGHWRQGHGRQGTREAGTQEAGTWGQGHRRQGHRRQGHGRRVSVATRTTCSHGIHKRPNQRDYVCPSWLSLVPLPLRLHFSIRGLWWVRMCGNFFLPHNEPGGESTVSVMFAAHIVQ